LHKVVANDLNERDILTWDGCLQAQFLGERFRDGRKNRRIRKSSFRNLRKSHLGCFTQDNSESKHLNGHLRNGRLLQVRIGNLRSLVQRGGHRPNQVHRSEKVLETSMDRAWIDPVRGPELSNVA